MSDLNEIRSVMGAPLRSLHTDAMTVGRWKQHDMDFMTPADGTVRLIVPLSLNHTVRHEIRGVSTLLPIRIGTPTLLDPRRDIRAIVEGPFDMFAVSIAEGAAPDPSRIDLTPDLDTQRTREQILRRILIHLHGSGPRDTLVLDDLITALCMALTRKDISGKPGRGGLTPRQIHDVTDLVETRISSPVDPLPTLTEMAGLAGLSLFHFSREFRATTGLSPYAFALNRTLKRVETDLTRSTLPIEQIAFRFGFASGAHLVKHFHKAMGVTPAAYRTIIAGEPRRHIGR